jgi:hypothetical protein
MRASILLASAALLASACAPEAAPDCVRPDDCGSAQSVCPACSPVVTDFCLDGTCEAAPEELSVDVSVDISLDRGIADEVASFVHVVASPTSGDGPLDCATAFSSTGVAPTVNAFASGYKTNLGGSLHQDVTLGRVPEGDVVILVVAMTENAGAGDVLATGCETGLTASGPSLDAGLVTVAP